MAKLKFPEGIDEEACQPRAPSRVVVIRFAIFISVLLLALIGVFGGRKSVVESAQSPAALFQVSAPAKLRNGNFFEIQFDVAARQPIADAVIAVPRAFWHDSTINSLVPDPEKQEWVDGEYRLHLGPVSAGQRLHMKVDGQLNPPLFGTVQGAYRLLDGERELVRLPVTIKVLP